MAIDRLRNNTIIILDTNSLFLPFQFKINLDSELTRLFGDYEIIIPSCVISEVRKLSTIEKFGGLALKLAQKIKAPKWYLVFEKELLIRLISECTEEGEGKFHLTVDNEILQIAKALNGIVLTNDKSFLKKLSVNGIPTVSLRGKKYLKLNSSSY